MNKKKSLSSQKLTQSKQLKKIKKIKKRLDDADQNQKELFLISIIFNLAILILSLIFAILLKA